MQVKRKPSRMFSQRSIHGRIAHEIGQQILRGDLAPGEVLPTRPTRRRLASAGPCSRGDQGWPPKGWSNPPRSHPRQGARSVEHARPRCPQLSPGLHDVSLRLAVSEMRRMLEPAGAALAAQRATLSRSRIRDALRAWPRPARRPRKASITICASSLHPEATNNPFLVPWGT